MVVGIFKYRYTLALYIEAIARATAFLSTSLYVNVVLQFEYMYLRVIYWSCVTWIYFDPELMIQHVNSKLKELKWLFLNGCRQANDNWNDSISWSTNDHWCHCHHRLLHQKVSSHKITRVVSKVFFSIYDFYFVSVEQSEETFLYLLGWELQQVN